MSGGASTPGTGSGSVSRAPSPPTRGVPPSTNSWWGPLSSTGTSLSRWATSFPTGWRATTWRPSAAWPRSCGTWRTWPRRPPTPGRSPPGWIGYATPVPHCSAPAVTRPGNWRASSGSWARWWTRRRPRAWPPSSFSTSSTSGGSSTSVWTPRGGVPSLVLRAFSDVRRLFDERLDAEVGRPDFFRGGITVTSLTPLRWVPFRVVCLLGMDQSAFGSTTVAGVDPSPLNPELGDTDPRSEVRESLLEAVLAAEDHLVVVRDGHDVRTNQPIARAVVTAELFDAVGYLVEPGDDEELERRLEIHHPRHAFDHRRFVEGYLGDGLVLGLDQGALNGARERRGRTSATVPFLGAPLEGTEVTTIELSDLHAFFKDPVEAFLTGRLQAKLPRPEELQSATIPLDLDGLEKWGIGDRLLRSRL